MALCYFINERPRTVPAAVPKTECFGVWEEGVGVYQNHLRHQPERSVTWHVPGPLPGWEDGLSLASDTVRFNAQFCPLLVG